MSRWSDVVGVVLVVIGTTACMSLGGWMGYKAGVQQGEANTMNDFLNRCLEEPVPPFCQGLLDMLNETMSSNNEAGKVP